MAVKDTHITTGRMRSQVERGDTSQARLSARIARRRAIVEAQARAKDAPEPVTETDTDVLGLMVTR